MHVNRFKGKVIERGLTMTELARKMGIDRSTLYRKIENDGSTLTIKEVNSICRILDLTKEEATAIFFSQVVA